jgi:hypothetical protein
LKTLEDFYDVSAASPAVWIMEVADHLRRGILGLDRSA